MTMTDNRLANIWPEWQIEKQLGRGSYGVVYQAVRRDHNVESYAAIKVISIPSDASEVDSLRAEGLDMNTTRTYLRRIVDDFVGEIQLMESLKGIQNIVSVEDYKVVEKSGGIGWDIYIRMELLTPFNTYIRDRKMSEKEVIRLGCDICTALEICGRRNIIHRDIKPENIFINDFGYFKLGDFGIARKMENLTGGLSQKGTFNYMAPEVASSSEYDARVDIYSLGIVLYRLLNGNRLPFLDNEQQLLNPNERRNAVERRIRGEALPAPSEASPAMADVILRACAFNPNARFASAAEMKQALISVGNGTYRMANPTWKQETASLRKEPKPNRQKAERTVHTFGDKLKKKRWPAILAAVLAIVVLAGGSALAVRKLIPREEAAMSNLDGNVNEQESTDFQEADGEEIAAILAEAEELAEAEDYEGALTKVQEGLTVYPEAEELQKKEEEYTGSLHAQAKSEALTAADALAQGGDYLSAIETIQQAELEVGEDNELAGREKEYEEAYAATVLVQADALIGEGQLDEAKAVLEQGIRAVSNNSELTAKLGSIDSMRPASLNALHVIDSDSFEYSDKMFTDSFGNVYDGSFHFEHVGYDNEYAIFNLRKECNVFTGSIVTCQDTGSDEQMVVYIYVDDVLKYTSPQFGKTSGKIDFSVDVTGGQQLMIKAGLVSGYWGRACFSLVNGQLSKDPDIVAQNLKNEQNDNYDINNAGLDKLFLIDSDNFEQRDEIFTDSFGNSYDGSYHFEHVGYDNEYATFNITQSSTAFSGSIVACQETGSEEEMIIMIYVDDVLKYTSPQFGKTTGKIDFNVDVTDGQKITIKAGLVSGYWGRACFSLVNVKLT